MVEQAQGDIVPPAELSRAAFTAQEVMDNLTLELDTETSLVPHGKVLSAPIIGHLTMPNLPNPMCPVSGVHSTTTIDLPPKKISLFKLELPVF